MELYTVKFVFLALTLDLSMAFLIDDVSTNQTSDIMTLLLQEKRERIQLEQRFQKFADAVTVELKAERDKINILEQTINNCSSENEELHKEIAAVTSELQTAEMFILNKLDIEIKNATNEIQNVVKRIEESENTSRIDFDKLVNEVQRLNFTFESGLANRTTLRKDNMVAFSVEDADDNNHLPQLFYRQPFVLGRGYNRSTGKFVCHTSGIYVFMWSITQDISGSSLRCCLLINGYRYGNACASTGVGAGDYQSGSRTTIIHLNKNDLVYLSCSSGSFDNYSGFSGFLLYPES